MKLIYVAGPYRSNTEWGLVENIRKAEEASAKLWQEGWAVICPHKNTAHFGGIHGIPDNVWLEGDIEILKRCDAIFMLNTWRQSEGARKELLYAESLGMEIRYQGG